MKTFKEFRKNKLEEKIDGYRSSYKSVSKYNGKKFS